MSPVRVLASMAIAVTFTLLAERGLATVSQNTRAVGSLVGGEKCTHTDFHEPKCSASPTKGKDDICEGKYPDGGYMTAGNDKDVIKSGNKADFCNEPHCQEKEEVEIWNAECEEVDLALEEIEETIGN